MWPFVVGRYELTISNRIKRIDLIVWLLLDQSTRCYGGNGWSCTLFAQLPPLSVLIYAVNFEIISNFKASVNCSSSQPFLFHVEFKIN